jgi:hypothetical protein
MSRISFKAVLLGFGAVLILDTLIGAALLAILGGDAFGEGRSEQQVNEAIQASVSSLAFLLSSVVLGSLTTVVGGYLAARIAKSYPYFNALALGLLGGAFGLLFSPQYPMWFNVLGLVLVVPAALLGAHLLTRISRARAAELKR